MVQWDRRGVGKTLGRTGKKGSGEMTFPRMVADGLELTEYLRGHLGKDAIVLMGGSAGNLVGLPMVKARPDLFCAYVGTDIVNNMARTQALAYRRAGERLRAAGNARGLSALEKISPDRKQWNVAGWTRVQQWVMKTDPVTPSFDRKVIMPLMFTSPAHTIRQVGHIGTGLSFAPARLFDQFMAFDAVGLGTQFQVPFFVFPGETDVINSTELAREYYSRIEAPHKEWVVIKDAGHFCAFVQPDRFLAEMLTRVRPFVAASLRH